MPGGRKLARNPSHYLHQEKGGCKKIMGLEGQDTRGKKNRVVLHDSDRSCVSSWWIEATRTASGAGTRRELPIILSGKAKDDCLPGMTLSFRATPPLRSPPSTRLGSVPDARWLTTTAGRTPTPWAASRRPSPTSIAASSSPPATPRSSKKTKSRGASHDRTEMK